MRVDLVSLVNKRYLIVLLNNMTLSQLSLSYCLLFEVLVKQQFVIDCNVCHLACLQLPVTQRWCVVARVWARKQYSLLSAYQV